MKALFELFRRFDARRIFGSIRRLGGHVISKSQVLRFAFYPRPLGGRRHQGISQKSNRASDFYPRLRVEGDLTRSALSVPAVIFLSTPSGWRATCRLEDCRVDIFGFLSTPSGWRATISALPPQCTCTVFLSTPSGWRATFSSGFAQHIKIFLSTPSGWRATFGGLFNSLINMVFLSTPSGWRATRAHTAIRSRPPISIHALRVEGDASCEKLFISTTYFYPRPPGGGRPSRSINRIRTRYFYPRPPGGGRQQKRTKFSSVFAQKGKEFASLRRGKRGICRWRFKKDKFWVLIWCEGSGKSVCALASHCG